MLAIASLLFSLSTAAAAAPTPAPAPQTHLVIAPCLAGEHQQFEQLTCDIELKNDGDKPITISKGEAAMAWDSIAPGVVVPAHGTAYLKATIATRDNAGYIKRSFRFATDEPGVLAVRGSSVHAFVSTVLDQHAPTIDFGAVKLSGTLPAKDIALGSREVADFRILAITSKPDYLDVSVDKDGRTVRASLLKNAPWGLVHDKIKLKINTPQQPEAWITIDANVIGEIAPGGNPFVFGLMRTNEKHEFLLRLTSESGKAFKVGTAKLDQVKGTVDVVPCVPAEAGCKLLRITVANDQMQGRLQGTINVELPEFKRTLPIQVVGMLLKPEVTIHNLNEQMEKAGQAKSAASPVEGVPAEPKGIDLQQAIKQTLNKDETAAPPGNGPLLRWSVANESSVYGYIIYRAEAETGPFLRVNKDIIPAADEAGAANGSYQWRDNSATSGKTYWYSIGTVKGNGEKVALSGAQKVVAK